MTERYIAFDAETPNCANDRMCAYLDLNLNHHNAGSDSRACGELLLDYMRHGLNISRHVRRYDLAQRRTMRRAYR